MKNKNSSTLALSAAILALMLMSAACSNNDSNANTTPSATPAVTASASPEAGEASSEPASAEPSEPSESPTELSGTGEYVGLSDGHSIEVRMEDGTVAFQISPEIADKVDPWEEGTPVKFQFTSTTLDVNGEKVTQYTIKSIDKQ